MGGPVSNSVEKDIPTVDCDLDNEADSEFKGLKEIHKNLVQEQKEQNGLRITVNQYIPVYLIVCFSN